jgi:hypothetical protein
LTFFVFIPIVVVVVLDLNRAPSESLFSGNEWFVFLKWALLIIILLVLFFSHILSPPCRYAPADELKLLLSSKIIRLENHQIKFISMISFFKKNIKLPKNVLELKIEEKSIKYQPTWLIEFRFISQDTAPLTFFKTRDKSLAKKISKEIADFYQIKLTKKFKN